MKKQITRIAPLAAAKVITLLTFFYAILAVAAATVMFYYRFPDAEIPYQRVLAMPFVYAGIGLVLSLLGALVYNLIARLIGGLEFTVEDKN